MDTTASSIGPTPHTVTIKVTGLNCTNCALSLEKQLTKLGAQSPTVDFASGRTRFSLATMDGLADLLLAIKELGYSVVDESEQKNISTTPSRQLLAIKATCSAACALPLMLGMFIPSWHELLSPPIQLLLATPSFLIGMFHFGRSAIRSLRSGVPNMDVLIVSGVSAAFVCSLASLTLGLSHEFIFFEAVCSIVTFVLVGQLLEAWAVQKTTSAINALMELQVNEVRRVSGSKGLEVVSLVPISEVKIGDLLQVNLGDRVPTDGVVERGGCLIDEAMLSGEPVPVSKATGDSVTGGTIVSSGNFTMRATAIGEKTTLASIIAMVQNAQSRRPELQRVGDRVSAIFVPAVVVFALVYFTGAIFLFQLSLAEAMVRALAIVVVACPCAMGLATPTAIMVAIGRAARMGVLIKGGDTLERLAQVSHVVFDKTGTITEHNIAVGKIAIVEADTAHEEIYGILSSLHQASSHPVSQAIREFVADRSPTGVVLHNVQEEPGVGISGIHPRLGEVAVGGFALARRLHYDSPADVTLYARQRPIAHLWLRDEVKVEAKCTVENLSKNGHCVSILSGDTASRVAEVAEKLDITNYYAHHLPAQKLARIEELSAKSVVAFVGDGVNDAPTLAKADVGISLSTASDVAIQSAQVILLNGNISPLPKVFRLAHLTVRTIKQNLAWALLYNVAAIPLAAFGYISPLWGALLMSFSDVVIVGNSLRLRSLSVEGPRGSFWPSTLS
jgi:Cu+-exporting ATPase